MRMTKFEVLAANESLLRMMRRNGITTKAVDYIDAYRELRLMEQDGEKTTFAVSTVASRYGISERKLYALKTEMSRRITVD